MARETRAVIDVGTNSVKVLVAQVEAGAVFPLLEESRQTRLGEGFYDTHLLQPVAITRTAEAVAEYVRTARAAGAQKLKVIATSAAREAQNCGELVKALENASQIPLTIISGETEALWSFRGVSTNPEFANSKLLVVDIGGGSTEFIAGKNGSPEWSRSIQLGTVRLLEHLPPCDPPQLEELLKTEEKIDQLLRGEIESELRRVLADFQPGMRFIATGGTASILARLKLQLDSYHREAMEGLELTGREIEEQKARLWQMPLAARKQVPGIPANRADVILYGVAIVSQLLRRFSFGSCNISTRGLRFAAVLD